MISILIPTYNYSILKLVKEINKQCILASFEFEIIVADDASTSIKIKEQNEEILAFKNCIYLKNNENLGRTATRNLLANQAKYDFLLFLDADVLPKYNDFISRFNLQENKDCQVIYGGICYEDKEPESDHILRWVYGKKRESKSVTERLKKPYFIISQNLLIKKKVFIATNSNNINTYGLDILFSNNLLRNNIKVKHIDNPVYHFGLENSQTFLKKSLEAVKTTYLLEESKQIDKNLRPLQKIYHQLNKLGLIGVLRLFIRLFRKSISSNLLSNRPSMLLFDLYRLNYYIELKKNKSA